MAYFCVVSIESRREISAQFIILSMVILVAGCSMAELNPLLDL